MLTSLLRPGRLNHYCFKEIAKEWFKYYLVDQKQFVANEDKKPSVKIVLTSVLQGSLLGQLLSLIYINDLSIRKRSSKSCYLADDANIMQESEPLEKLAKQINKDLSNISY